MATLFDALEYRTIQKAFDKYHAANPRVWALFVRFALQALDAGCVKYSADAILHRIRWHLSVETASVGDGFKINNNFSSRYARKLMTEDPRFAQFFETRKLQD